MSPFLDYLPSRLRELLDAHGVRAGDVITAKAINECLTAVQCSHGFMAVNGDHVTRYFDHLLDHLYPSEGPVALH